MQLEKPQLFADKKSFIAVMAFLFLATLLHLFVQYQKYQLFIEKPFFYTQVKVLSQNHKTKGKRAYEVLKVRDVHGLTFYTTTYRKKSYLNQTLRLQLFPDKKISFLGYIGTFFIKSRIKSTSEEEPSFKALLYEKVERQHDDESLKSFYKAIFFATPIAKELRKKISMLGTSHLVALSGFHLGILWAVVYGFLSLFYRQLQQRYFPYRYALLDVGSVTIVLLGFYLWFVDFPPSLLRSYAMVLAGWMIVLMGVELVSFTFLATILMLLVALFPSLLVSLSFWLSIAGVFYIFLLLRHTKEHNKWIIALLFIPFGIFVFMLPVVHMIFDVTTPYQLYSPLISLLFTPFYPVVILAHLVGFGDLFDSILLYLFALPDEKSLSHQLLPLWAGGSYVLLSVAAIYSRRVFYLLFFIAFIYALSLFIF